MYSPTSCSFKIYFHLAVLYIYFQSIKKIAFIRYSEYSHGLISGAIFVVLL
jgi:hypothetical protein